MSNPITGPHFQPPTPPTDSPRTVPPSTPPFPSRRAGRQVGEPVGEQARWKTLYEHLETLQPGELFTWAEMGRMLNLDPIEQRPSLGPPLRRAVEVLMREHRRAVVLVRGVGWRIATPEEQLETARHHQKRALVEVNRGLRQVEAVDPDKLDPQTRKGFEMVGALFRHQAAVMNQLDVRQQRLEKVMAAVQDGQRRTEQAMAITQDTVQDLRARLDNLERQRAKPPPPTSPSPKSP